MKTGQTSNFLFTSLVVISDYVNSGLQSVLPSKPAIIGGLSGRTGLDTLIVAIQNGKPMNLSVSQCSYRLIDGLILVAVRRLRSHDLADHRWPHTSIFGYHAHNDVRSVWHKKPSNIVIALSSQEPGAPKPEEKTPCRETQESGLNRTDTAPKKLPSQCESGS
jgi:hypothetical protein